MRGGRARILSTSHNPESNDTTGRGGNSQSQVLSETHFRPDLTVFLNGMPVVVIELKSPSDTGADLGVAIDQLDRYKQTLRPTCSCQIWR